MRVLASYAQWYDNRGHWQFHSGVDIAMRYHDPVLASWSGVVCHVGPLPGFGHTVCVDHQDGTWSRYAHLGGYYVRVGQRVESLHRLGVVGVKDEMAIHLHLDYTIVDLGQHPAHWAEMLPEVLTLYRDPLNYLK